MTIPTKGRCYKKDSLKTNVTIKETVKNSTRNGGQTAGRDGEGGVGPKRKKLKKREKFHQGEESAKKKGNDRTRNTYGETVRVHWNSKKLTSPMNRKGKRKRNSGGKEGKKKST